MSSHPNYIKGRRTALVALLAMMALVAMAALVVADHPTDEDANNGGSGLSEWTGEWNVAAGDDLEYANQTISLDGTLIINNGGRLVLRNVTLLLHGGELDPQEINVFDGELVITDLDDDPDTIADGSMVMADDPEVHYYFQVYEDATITVTNSHIMDCGRLFDVLGIQAGLYINTIDAVIEGVEFSNNFGGIFIDGVDITVSDSYIHDNEWIGIYVANSAALLIEDCNIEDNLREGMVIKSQSDVELRDSWVRGNMRGIVVDGAYLAAYDTSISSNTEVDLNLPYFSQVEMFNCTISVSPTNTPIKMENSSLTSTHGNFDIGSVDMTDSVFLYRQFLTVIVTWSASRSTPIEDVPVKVEDSEARIFNFFTDENGTVADVPMEVVYYKMSGLGLEATIYNPFHVTVTHNLQEQDMSNLDMRYTNGLARFQYLDSVDPTAVAPA
ncbi:MAG: right-handed parallel beta-helix repeat-containing protein, partial [Thermoplasmata archaeon]|nr:right-handed parallel beta-helix repeat-containing protein [Thermoplasmata archaeon]